jgi:hypothetical protein
MSVDSICTGQFILQTKPSTFLSEARIGGQNVLSFRMDAMLHSWVSTTSTHSGLHKLTRCSFSRDNHASLLLFVPALCQQRRGMRHLPCVSLDSLFVHRSSTIVHLIACAACRPFSKRQSSRRLPCNHAFHAKCVGSWLTSHNSCPLCRVVVSKTFSCKYLGSRVVHLPTHAAAVEHVLQEPDRHVIPYVLLS